jgi:hypothetical protein
VTRRMLLSLLAVIFVAEVGFIVAILANLGSGVALHEIAASILLLLLVAAFGLAWGLRATSRAPLYRVAVSLIALVAAAAIGTGLATSALSDVWTGLPLVPLAVMLGSVADGIRLTLRLPTACRPSVPPSTHP